MSASLLAQLGFDALWSGVAAAGFAVLFNTPRRLLAGCFLIGATAHALRAGLMLAGLLGIEAGTLVAASMIGFSSLALARKTKVPVITFALPAAIPMVPGVLAFKAMLGMLRLVAGQGTTDPALALAALISAVKTALILTAIVIGVGSPCMVFRQREPVDLGR